MNIYDEPKIDCHNHIFDPSSFPYAADAYYRPAGQEIGTAAQFRSVLDAYGVRHALVVGPNSGYGQDNRCLLDAMAKSGGRFKGRDPPWRRTFLVTCNVRRGTVRVYESMHTRDKKTVSSNYS